MLGYAKLHTGRFLIAIRVLWFLASKPIGICIMMMSPYNIRVLMANDVLFITGFDL